MSGECESCSEHCLDCKCKVNKMDRKEDILFKLDAGRKAYFRGGSILKKVLQSSYNHVISGEDALLVFNTYGIDMRLLRLLFLSHGLDIDEERFCELLIEQEERMKNCKPC